MHNTKIVYIFIVAEYLRCIWSYSLLQKSSFCHDSLMTVWDDWVTRQNRDRQNWDLQHAATRVNFVAILAGKNEPNRWSARRAWRGKCDTWLVIIITNKHKLITHLNILYKVNCQNRDRQFRRYAPPYTFFLIHDKRERASNPLIQLVN